MKDWKQIEQGDPSVICIMLMSTGTAGGSLAYFCCALQQHMKIQTKRHINGTRAMKRTQAKNSISIRNSEIRKRTITIIYPSCIGYFAISTIPKMKRQIETKLKILMVHLLSGSLDRAKDLIMLETAGSTEALTRGVTSAMDMLV